jgi:glyoxylase I family protein
MIRGIHHLGLTVRDVDASAVWYRDVLGFRCVDEYEAPDGARRKVFRRHDRLHVRLGLTQHRAGSRDPFDETRVGLDHLAFCVADRQELEAWARRLSDAGVIHSPIAAANSIPGAVVLVFRDPDNIQLETNPRRSQAMIHWAMIDSMSRRLTGESTPSWRYDTTASTDIARPQRLRCPLISSRRRIQRWPPACGGLSGQCRGAADRDVYGDREQERDERSGQGRG